MIAISLSPNTEKDDISLARKLIFSPWRWQRGPAATLLETEFSQWLGGLTTAISFNSGRTALYAILSSLGLSPNDEVLLQAFTCVAVPGPVLWTGAKPVYVDCADDYTMSAEDLKRKITANSKVLIIQHTFGLVAHMDELLKIAREHKLFVIEDCVHAMGSTYKGAKVGTLGDAAIFSFGRDKCLSSVFGGLAVTADNSLASKLKQKSLAWGEPNKTWILQQLLHPLILSLSKKFYDFAGLSLGKAILATAVKLNLISKAVYPEEKSGGEPPFGFKRMPNALAALALNQFRKLPKFIEHRKKIADLYRKTLPSAWFAPQTPESNPVYLRLPIQIDNPRQIILKARQQAVELGDWYVQPLAPKGVDHSKIHFTPESCPNATRLTQRVLNLPTNIQINEAKVYKVINLLKQL